MNGIARVVASIAVVVASSVLGPVVGCSNMGCAAIMSLFDDVNQPEDDVKLKKCRDEGRAAADAGSSPHRAYDIYTECKKDAGLK